MTEHDTPTPAAADEAAATRSWEDLLAQAERYHVAKASFVLAGSDGGFAPFVAIEVHHTDASHPPIEVLLVPKDAVQLGTRLIRGAELSLLMAGVSCALTHTGYSPDELLTAIHSVMETRIRYEAIPDQVDAELLAETEAGR